jgi:hypothetical protein
MRAGYSFDKLEAIVFGTHVNVICTNVTYEYLIKTGLCEAEVTKDSVEVTVAQKPHGPNFRLSHWFGNDFILETESLVREVVMDSNASK